MGFLKVFYLFFYIIFFIVYFFFNDFFVDIFCYFYFGFDFNNVFENYLNFDEYSLIDFLDNIEFNFYNFFYLFDFYGYDFSIDNLYNNFSLKKTDFFSFYKKVGLFKSVGKVTSIGDLKPIDLVKGFPYSHSLAWVRFITKYYYDDYIDYQFL
jgi:hypothetical protein